MTSEATMLRSLGPIKLPAAEEGLQENDNCSCPVLAEDNNGPNPLNETKHASAHSSSRNVSRSSSIMKTLTGVLAFGFIMMRAILHHDRVNNPRDLRGSPVERQCSAYFHRIYSDGASKMSLEKQFERESDEAKSIDGKQDETDAIFSALDNDSNIRTVILTRNPNLHSLS